MELIKIQLPVLAFSSYQLLWKALRYYLNASTEFVINDEITMGLCEMLDYIEETYQEVNSQIQLPKIAISSYQLILKALRYYIVSSSEFFIDTQLSIEIYNMIDYMEREHQEVEIAIDYKGT